MTRDEIIRMAREAGMDPHDMSSDWTVSQQDLERFAAMVAAAERKKTENLVAEMLYVVEAFYRGCNSEDYYMEIEEVVENTRKWLEDKQ